jgi:hypothetical protein
LVIFGKFVDSVAAQHLVDIFALRKQRHLGLDVDGPASWMRGQAAPMPPCLQPR